MTLRSLLRAISSLRTTAVLFAALLFTLFLRVLLPQESVVGAGAVQEATNKSRFLDLLLNGLELKDVTSSPLFLVIAAMFYVNLALVLVSFSKAVAARMRYVPAAFSGWRNAALKIERDEAVRKLRKFSFDLREMDGEAVWGVRNRYSPVGFMLFHFSLFLFLTSGAMLYATRYVARVDLMKDATFEFNPEQVKVVRKPVFSPDAKPFMVTLTSVQAEKEQGSPVRLMTGLSFMSFGHSRELTAEVNRPASFLGYSFLPFTKDTAFVFTTYDENGAEKGKYFIMSELESGRDLEGSIGEGRVLKIKRGGDNFEVSGSGASSSARLEPGAGATLPGMTVVLSGVTEWVSFLVVHEKGPSLLIAGFVLATLGLSIRFVFPRQDVVISGGRVYFRGEYFPLALRYLMYEIGADDDSF